MSIDTKAMDYADDTFIAVSERIEDSGRQHRRAAMRKRNGWCIWSPWSGYLSSTFAGTRTECIKLFERDSNSPWRRYREQGFECRPVLFVDAREESGDAAQSGRTLRRTRQHTPDRRRRAGEGEQQ